METESKPDARGALSLPWFPPASELDREELERFGRIIDLRPLSFDGGTVCMALAAQMLQVRRRDGRIGPLRANSAQRGFEERRGSRNIILKARQMGLTTWAAARFFLKTITQPGTLTLQVAHTREAAEEIFRIVHRFAECMPASMRSGPLKTSRANVHALAFPVMDTQYLVVSAGERNAGRGLTVQNLHCSEIARWPGDPAETLAGLRAALAPNSEVILESTPDGVGGCFYEEWQRADETGTVQHFFPWWLESRYRGLAVAQTSLSAEERELMARRHLDLAQIGYRRQLRAGFRGLAAQEFAEDSESCFRASGESVFEIEPIEARMLNVRAATQTRWNGSLEIWLPPLKGKTYIVAVDPAGGGVDGDYSAAQIIDLESGAQCAEFAAHVGGSELARAVTGFAEEYNRACLVIERNNHGAAVLCAAEELCHYAKIYRRDNRVGWPTDKMTRPAMVGLLHAALLEHPECFQSKKLLAECRSFVRLRDGSTGARAGTHDDRLMAMAIALAARAELLPRSRARDSWWNE